MLAKRIHLNNNLILPVDHVATAAQYLLLPLYENTAIIQCKTT